MAQNSKGDRPVKNQRQVRETKAKSVSKKEKGRTRDIANRRLRTKDKSSANRANINFRRPTPYAGRKSKGERAARPRGRVFSQAPSERHVRAWKGDVSGYPIKRVHPTNADAARSNVYPQKGPYVRYARKQPKARPPVYSKTIKGNPFIRHEPRREERAWKGGADHGPIKNQSATGTIKNTYSQKGPYVAYYRKKGNSQSRPISNSREVRRVKRLSHKPKTGGSQGAYYPNSASGPFIQRGKKNVYWGKYQRKERGVTGDLTGRPLRTRNYKSMPAGLIGRDTLKFFGRHPQGERVVRAAGGTATATRKGQRSWRGDVAGWPLRKSRSGQGAPKKLTPTQPGIGADWIAKTFNKRFRGVKPSQRKQDRRAYRFQGNLPSSGASKTFSDQGTGFSGNLRRWQLPSYNRQGAGYSGNIRRQGATKTFGDQGVGYSGNIRRQGATKTFGDQGVGYSGNIRYRGAVKTFEEPGIDYPGFIRRGQRGFDRQGAGFSGTLKAKRANKGGGSVSGQLWNNNNRSVSQPDVGAGNLAISRYKGNQRRWEVQPGITEQGAGFSGNIKTKRPKKGGGSISGKLWNNGNTAIAGRLPGGDNPRAVNYSGFIKGKRPEKGGGSVSGKVWNNNNTAIAGHLPGGDNPRAINYSGFLKGKRPEKGGGSVSGKMWNNNNIAIPVRTPLGNAGIADYSGKIPLSRFKKNYVQNPNASRESLKKLAPDKTAYKVAGLQIKVREAESRHNPNSSKAALDGLAPEKGHRLAARFQGNHRMPTYKHNPNSSHDALMVVAVGKADGRIGDYQGNLKMRKYTGGRLHPDAQFAHGYRDNVKEERTIMMNIKLFWGKVFRKSETQPENLKEKLKKPQYDKREKDLWYR